MRIKSIKIVYVFAIFAATGIICGAISAYGNPQWSKWIYIAQAYIYRKGGYRGLVGDTLTYDHIILPPPAGYTGIWMTWYKCGKLSSKAEYIDGKLCGKSTSYYMSGRIKAEGYHAYDIPVGVQTQWYENGNVAERYEWRNGKANGEYVIYDEKGVIQLRQLYKDGILIESYDRQIERAKIKKMEHDKSGNNADLRNHDRSIPQNRAEVMEGTTPEIKKETSNGINVAPQARTADVDDKHGVVQNVGQADTGSEADSKKPNAGPQ